MSTCPCPLCKTLPLKAPRSSRAGRLIIRTHTRHLLATYRATKRWFATVDKQVRRGLARLAMGITPLGKAGPSYTAVHIADWLVDWDAAEAGARKYIGPHQVKVYGEAFGQAALLAKLKTPWNLQNRKAIEWSRRYMTPHMRDLVAETRLGIQRLITDGLERGLSVPQVAREMRRLESFSMNPGQARALGNYRTKLGAVQDRIGAALAESGGNAAEAGRLMRGKVPKAWIGQVRDGRFDVDGRVAKEAGRKARYRAEMIARTETSRAVSEGTLEGYAEAGVQMVRWEAAADACEVCAGWDGTVMTLAEGEGMIPEHSNCRCTWVPEEPAEAAVTPSEAAAEEEAEEEFVPGGVPPDTIIPEGIGGPDYITANNVWSNQKMDSWAKEKLGGNHQYVASLGDEQKQALSRYKSSWYSDINAHLRGKPITLSGPSKKQMEQYITQMDSVFSKANLGEDVTVWRGSNGAWTRGLAKGSEFVDNGFISTSFQSEVGIGRAVKGEYPVMFEIRAKSSAKAVYTDFIGTGIGGGGEAELLLNRRMAFRVVDEGLYQYGEGKEIRKLIVEVL